MTETLVRDREWLEQHLGRIVWDQRMHFGIAVHGIPHRLIDTYENLGAGNGVPLEVRAVLDELEALGVNLADFSRTLPNTQAGKP